MNREGMVLAMVFVVAFFLGKTDGQMAYAGVQRGKLSDASSKSLLTKLSSSALQPAAWRQLLHSHPLALKYFLVAGAPKGEQSSLEQYSYPAGLGTTLSACIADYESIAIKQGIGKITVKACVLMFDCLDNECGALTPVVLVKDKMTNSSKYSTIWQRLPGSTVVTNAAPAFVPPGVTEYDKSKFRPRFVSLGSCCSGDEIPFQVIRSVSEASLGVVPLSCHQLPSSFPVSGNVAYDFLLLRNLKKAYVLLLNITISRPLEECSKAPMLLRLKKLFRACVPSNFISKYICSSFSYASFQKAEVSFLSAVVSNLNVAYGYARRKNRIMSLLGHIRAGISSNILILEGPLHLESSCMDTCKEEHAENMAELCYLGLSNFKPDNYDSCAFCTGCMCQTAEVETMELKVKLEQLTMSYIDEHTTLFNNDNGQAIDTFSAWSQILICLIAIIVLSVPLQKVHRCIHPWVQNKFLIYLLLSAIYIVWIFPSALPLISFIKSEISRGLAYETWTLVPTDMMLNSHGKQVNLLLVFSGESIYESKMWLWAIGLMVVVLSTVIAFRIAIVKLVRGSFDKENDETKLENGKARKKQLKVVVISVTAMIKFKQSSGLLAVDIIVA